MCVEDIKLGKASRAYQVSTVFGATAIEIAPEDKHRIALVVGAPTSGTMFIGHDPNVTVLTGVPVPTNFPPIVFNVKDHGEIVTGKLFAIISAGTPSVTVLCASLHLPTFERGQVQ